MPTTVRKVQLTPELQARFDSNALARKEQFYMLAGPCCGNCRHIQHETRISSVGRVPRKVHSNPSCGIGGFSVVYRAFCWSHQSKQ